MHPPSRLEVDVHVNADLDAIYQVWLGRLDLRAAARAGSVELHGAAALVRRMPEVFLLSPVAPLVAAAAIDDRSHPARQHRKPRSDALRPTRQAENYAGDRRCSAVADLHCPETAPSPECGGVGGVTGL